MLPPKNFQRQILLKFFDPNSECFAKYDTFCSHIFDYACLRPRFEIVKKLYASKIFLKMAVGRMHIPHPTPLDSPLTISYRNHQKNLAYFSHLAPLVLFFLLKNRVKGGHSTMAPYLNTLLRAKFRQ